MSRFSNPNEALRYHVTGAIERGEKQAIKGVNFWDKPCAAYPLDSYRVRGRFGWVMIGASTDADALREAYRSTVPIACLQKWDGEKYTDVTE